MRKPSTGIFCLEGAWRKRLDDRDSVLPTLEMLERLQLATYIHRDVGTEEELYHYLAKWAQRGYSSYSVLYFAFHGVKGGIEVGRGTVPLNELADKLQGKAKGRIIYFGSCSVMSDHGAVEDFQRATGAKVVCGYRKDVDWVESAAFDLLLLESLTSNRRIDAKVNRVRHDYRELSAKLGFENYPAFPRRKSG